MTTALMIAVPVLVCVHSIKNCAKNQIRKLQFCNHHSDCQNCSYGK